MTTAAAISVVPHREHKSPRELLLRLTGEALFWLVVMQLVAGIYLQAQLAVFDNHIRFSNGFPKMALVGLVMMLGAGVVWLRQGRVAVRPSLLPACIFLCYLAADFAWLSVNSRLPLGALIFGFNKYFLFFATIPAAAILRPRLSTRQMNLRLLILLVPLVGLALAQYATNSSLLPVVSEDGLFEVPAVDFYGQIRAFSLFRGVVECGQGLAFFGALLVATMLAGRAQDRWWKSLLLALTAGACVATFRRGAYLEFGASCLSAYMISRRWQFSRWLPLAYLAMAVTLASAGTLLNSDNEGLMSSESLTERHDAWTMVLDKLLEQEGSLFFGTGLSQTSLLGTGLAQIESEEIDYFLVDNGFLAVAAQLGVIGLVLWWWVMHVLWRDMLDTAWRSHSTLAIAVSALLSTWMMRNMFDPLFALYPLYVFLVFWARSDGPQPSQAPRRAALEATCA